MKAHTAIVLLGALASTALLGCGRQEETPLPVRPVGDLHHAMTWVVDPAADVIWGSAGFVVTAEGARDLAPATEEGWARVRHSAAVVAESGNLLLLPHLAPAGDGASSGRPPADWIEFASGMTSMAEQALQAVDAQDAEALFEAGGHLYNVCVACHQVYARADSAGDAYLSR